jgi:hypothetical protein
MESQTEEFVSIFAALTLSKLALDDRLDRDEVAADLAGNNGTIGASHGGGSGGRDSCGSERNEGEERGESHCEEEKGFRPLEER